MTTQTEALKLALEAFKRIKAVDKYCDILSPSLDDAVGEAVTAIKEALAQPEQEPVQCWKCGDMDAAFHAKCDVPACGMKEDA